MKQSHYTETPYHYAKTILTMHEIQKKEDLPIETPHQFNSIADENQAKAITKPYMNAKKNELSRAFIEKLKQLVAAGKPMSA